MSAIGSRIAAGIMDLLKGGKAAVELEKYTGVSKALASGKTISGYKPAGNLVEILFHDGSKVKINPFTHAPGLQRQAASGKKLGEIVKGISPSVTSGGKTSLVSPASGYRPPALQSLSRRYRGAALEAPVTTVAGTALGAEFAGQEIGQPLLDVFNGPGNITRQATAEDDLSWETMRQRAQMERVQKLRAHNVARLASARPDLYTQIVAGQQLPDGAIPIGGEPRMDLVAQMAQMMSSGQFGRPA